MNQNHNHQPHALGYEFKPDDWQNACSFLCIIFVVLLHFDNTSSLVNLQELSSSSLQYQQTHSRFSSTGLFKIATVHRRIFLWPPYGIGQAIIFLPCGFYLSFFFYIFPRLISAAADWMSTILRHMMWP